jgi:Uma2 family endonuclease
MSVTAQPISPPVEQNADVPDVPIYRLTVAQYHAMAEAGILDEDTPVELLEGWLVWKMTKKRPHSVGLQLTRQSLEGLLPPGWYLSIQDPITTDESEPEPDIAVVKGSARDYPDRHPGPTVVPLVIEIADTTVRTDRGTKKRIYARAGIPVYWIVNLVARQVEVYTQPSPTRKRPDYLQRHDYGMDSAVPVEVDGTVIGSLPVAELLP